MEILQDDYKLLKIRCYTFIHKGVFMNHFKEHVACDQDPFHFTNLQWLVENIILLMFS